jgi:hypothetical protein
MSKKRDPVLAVLKYFQEAEVPLAQQALSLAAAIVKTRAATPNPTSSPHPRPVAKKPPMTAAGGTSE